ncbi:PH domain containing protein [Rhodotorula toruloides]|uniref:PH domain containing protein n=1 Tax=Rhodotorula toruloides TaxID=5286 RepID=A0A511KAF4_RHOTO|nr:PH domain containing protein [Rhodotorula toruloides]
MSRATESSSTSSAQGPAGKPGVESFSYVEPAALRFVVDLPIAPTTPPEPSDAGPSTSTSSSHAMAGASSGSAAAMPTQSALHGLAPAHARANKPPHSTYSATPTLASSAAPDSTDGLVRTNSKGRRRLSVSLTNLLHPGKRDRRRTDDSSRGGTSTPGSVSSRTLDGRTGMQSSRAASVASPTVSRRASIDEHADPSGDPSRSRRSPDLIDSQPRQQDTAGRDRCGLLEECRAASNSSQGSLDAVATNSNASTAPTSPDALASQDCDEDEFVSPAERRRRGSLALAKQLRDDDREDETEGAIPALLRRTLPLIRLASPDLTEFLRASGSPSTSPVPHSGPFVRRPSGASSPTPPSLAAFPPPFTSAIATTSGTASPPLHPRRLTRNIEGLSLGDLRHSPPPATRPPVLPSVAASPFTVTSVPQPEPRPSRASSGRAQLGAMPRLLSTNAIATVDTHEDEQEDSESDSDSQDGQSEEDDEGETYETSDEGPVTIRSPLATPAASPLASSSQPRTPGFGPPLSTNPSLRNSRLPTLTHLAAAGASAAPSQSSWVSFATAIPTPSTIRDLRAAGPSNGPSYFDLPRPSSSCTAKTPLVPPQTPLVPMSISEIARGKRPALQEDVEAAAAAVQAGPSTSEASDRAATGHDGGVRGGLYRLRSQSVVQLASPSMVDAEGQPVGTAALTELDPVWRSGAPAKQRTPAPLFLSFNLNQQSPQSPATSVVQDAVTSTPITPAPLDTAALPAPTASASPAPVLTESPTTARSRPATGTPGGHRLQRTRSMYELRDAPPPYNAVYRKAGLGAPQIVHPREEEGCEGLPPYTCAIHIEGYMPRKMEFTAPGIQARDRAWKRQYFVLHGTSIKIYKYDLRTHPIPGEEDWSTVPVDIAGHDGPPPLHFHEGEYGVAKEQSANHKFPLSITDAKAKAKDRIITSATASAQNSLVRHYSLQNAESGLAADYVKRKHVVRVRAEGEQFLLQAKDDRGVIDLIEALQAATNVALDLDARPLPKFITLPRRRRRRRPRPDANAAAAPAANGASATATAGAAAAEGPTETERMGDMLAEEQNSYARRSSATVM